MQSALPRSACRLRRSSGGLVLQRALGLPQTLAPGSGPFKILKYTTTERSTQNAPADGDSPNKPRSAGEDLRDDY